MANKKDVADLYGITLSKINEHLESLRQCIHGCDDETLLVYLQKYDLDLAKCINMHFSGSTPQKNDTQKKKRRFDESGMDFDESPVKKRRKLNNNINNNHNHNKSNDNHNNKEEMNENRNIDNIQVSHLNSYHPLLVDAQKLFNSESNIRQILNPIVLHNNNQIITTQSNIKQYIKDANCVISEMNEITNIISAFTTNNVGFTTKQFVSMVGIECIKQNASNHFDFKNIFNIFDIKQILNENTMK
eukprot:316380_1